MIFFQGQIDLGDCGTLKLLCTSKKDANMFWFIACDV